MRKFLFSPNTFGNGLLWLVAAAMGIGGWVSHTVAYILLGIAALWSLLTAIYYFKGRGKKQQVQEENDKLREERVKHRQIYSDRINIPKLLLQLHEYVIGEIDKQQVPQEEATIITKQLVKATNKFTAILILITYCTPEPLQNKFTKSYESSIPTLIRNWNAVLKGHNLGILVVTESEMYKDLYQQITAYKLGLPPKIVTKIDKCIMKSELFSSVVLWESLLGVAKIPRRIKWQLSLVLPYVPEMIDRNTSKLRSEVSDEIEGFLLGE